MIIAYVKPLGLCCQLFWEQEASVWDWCRNIPSLGHSATQTLRQSSTTAEMTVTQIAGSS